ncbi:MAG TPA: hypothetical protein VNZ05_00500 [Solirubrobacteraceae bacterium]|nr:hypothetical protein [Solirubrobacteraceae bacterium]
MLRAGDLWARAEVSGARAAWARARGSRALALSGFTGAFLLALGGSASALGPSASAAKHGSPAFHNKVTPPPTPAPLALGSDLSASPAALLGAFSSDNESWNVTLAWSAHAARAAAAANPTTVPVEGWLSSVTIKGFAVSGETPGPGGSEPFRVGVEQVLPTGQLEVVSTSDPPFHLPGTSGTYAFAVGPPSTGFAMRLRKGDVVSFDNRGGTWAVYANTPGSTMDSSAGTGMEQNAAVKWTGAAHANTELLMQVSEQPKVPTADLESASGLVTEAQALAHLAASAPTGKARRQLKQAGERLQAAGKAVEAALLGSVEGETAPALPELSAETAASLKHYLALALAEDRAGAGKGVSKNKRATRVKASYEAGRSALSDLRKARDLARALP